MLPFGQQFPQLNLSNLQQFDFAIEDDQFVLLSNRDEIGVSSLLQKLAFTFPNLFELETVNVDIKRHIPSELGVQPQFQIAVEGKLQIVLEGGVREFIVGAVVAGLQVESLLG